MLGATAIVARPAHLIFSARQCRCCCYRSERDFDAGGRTPDAPAIGGAKQPAVIQRYPPDSLHALNPRWLEPLRDISA